MPNALRPAARPVPLPLQAGLLTAAFVSLPWLERRTTAFIAGTCCCTACRRSGAGIASITRRGALWRLHAIDNEAVPEPADA